MSQLDDVRETLLADETVSVALAAYDDHTPFLTSFGGYVCAGRGCDANFDNDEAARFHAMKAALRFAATLAEVAVRDAVD